MRIIRFERRGELEKFLESDDPIAQLAEEEGSFIGDTCVACDEVFEIIIYCDEVNIYLCSEHFADLKNLMEGKLSDKIRLIKFETKEELEKFLEESDDPIAQLARLEGVKPDTYTDCEICDEDFKIIIYCGFVNHYFCSEHFIELRNLLSNG